MKTFSHSSTSGAQLGTLTVEQGCPDLDLVGRSGCSRPAKALWFDRSKFVFLNFMVEDSKDVRVDIQEDKLIFSCKSADDTDIYNEIHFFDKVQPKDSRERRYDRTINVLLRKMKENVAWPRMTKDTGKPIWLAVDFDNWRDWETEEEEGMAEYEKYLDPDDRGVVNDIPVLRVTRQGADALHFVTSPLPEGCEAHMKVDWERRFDHMQQHSAPSSTSRLRLPEWSEEVPFIVHPNVLPHDLPAALLGVAEVLIQGSRIVQAPNRVDLPSSSPSALMQIRELGRQRSVIELDTPGLKPEQLEFLERTVNEKIRASVPVNVREVSVDDPLVEQVRSRGLPDDHAGPIRIIEIEGIDSNMCCGTHVSNLSHLQAIKILGVEKGKKNKSNLIFIAGNRILQYTDKCFSVEKALNSLLKTGPEEHVEAVDKIQKSVKMLQKSNLNLLRDLAVLTAQAFKSDPKRGKLFTLHRKDGDNEFMNIIANEIGTEETLIFLTVGDEKAAGLFLLAGPVEMVESLGPRVSEMLEGKGAGKNGRYQGRANRMSRRSEVTALLQESLELHSQQEE
ncbi:AASD1 protein, partial [Polypterus senegalus]